MKTLTEKETLYRRLEQALSWSKIYQDHINLELFNRVCGDNKKRAQQLKNDWQYKYKKNFLTFYEAQSDEIRSIIFNDVYDTVTDIMYI